MPRCTTAATSATQRSTRDADHDSFLLDDAQYHADVAAYLDRIET